MLTTKLRARLLPRLELAIDNLCSPRPKHLSASKRPDWCVRASDLLRHEPTNGDEDQRRKIGGLSPLDRSLTMGRSWGRRLMGRHGVVSTRNAGSSPAASTPVVSRTTDA